MLSLPCSQGERFPPWNALAEHMARAQGVRAPLTAHSDERVVIARRSGLLEAASVRRPRAREGAGAYGPKKGTRPKRRSRVRQRCWEHLCGPPCG